MSRTVAVPPEERECPTCRRPFTAKWMRAMDRYQMYCSSECARIKTVREMRKDAWHKW